MEYLHSVPETHFGGNPLLVQLLSARPDDIMQTRRLLLPVPRTIVTAPTSSGAWYGCSRA